MSDDRVPAAPLAVPFISYSRTDSAFALRLAGALTAAGRDPWIDTEDIPPSVEWEQRIRQAILDTDGVVFLLSKASAASPRCHDEIELAVEAGKRIIPIRLEEVPRDQVDPEIRKRNYFAFDADDFDGSTARLIEVLDSDYDWLVMHSWLQARASEWIAAGRGRSGSLSGPRLREAEEWLAKAPAHPEPAVTAIQTDLILGSRRRQTRIVRAGLLVAAVAAVVFGGLGVFAWTQRNEAIAQQQVATARQLSAQAQAIDDEFDLSLLLAVEAQRLSDRPDVYAGLLRTVAKNDHIETFLHHDAGQDVYSVAFSPDGRSLATGSLDGTISLWDRALRSRSTVHGHEGAVRSVAFTPDGQRLVSGGEDGHVAFWRVEDGKLAPEASSEGHKDWVMSVAVEPGGALAASGGMDGVARLWDLDTLQASQPIPTGGEPVWSLAFGPDRSTLAVGTNSGDILLVDLLTNAQKRLTGHTGPVESVAFSPDGKMLASGGIDESVRRWDVESGKQIGPELMGHDSIVTSVAFDPQGSVIASGSWDETVALWSAADGAFRTKDLHHTGMVTSLSFAPDLTLATGGTDANAVLIRPFGESRMATTLTSHTGEIIDIEVSPDGRLLATTADGKVTFWDLATQAPIGEPVPIEIEDVSFSPDSSSVLAQGSSGMEHITPAGVVTPAPIDYGAATDASPSPDGTRIVAIGANGIAWFDASTWAREHAVPAGTLSNDTIDSMSADGSTVITADDDDGTVSIWRIDAPSRVGDEISDPNGYVDTAVSPDGHRFVIYRADGTMEVHDTATQRQIGKGLVGHQSAIFDVAYSLDGRLLASGDQTGNLILWDAQSGVRMAGPLVAHDGPVQALSFSPTADRLVTAGQDGRLKSWGLAPEQLVQRACETANRNLTQEEWARFIGSLPYHETCPASP